MVTKNELVDTYIERAKPFAQPILRHLRKLIHRVCPNIVEHIKWGFPHFDYKGTLCSMASFQEHCAFIFWKGTLMKDFYEVMVKDRKNGMGQFGRIGSLEDLPSDEILCEYLQEAMKLNDENIKLARKPTEEKELQIPEDFSIALQEKTAALKVFQGFSLAKKKDYINWVKEAKRETTRKKRIDTALEWLSEGKCLNWKYME